MAPHRIALLGHGHVGTATARALVRRFRYGSHDRVLTIGYRGDRPPAASDPDLAGVAWLPVKTHEPQGLQGFCGYDVVLVTFPTMSSQSSRDPSDPARSQEECFLQELEALASAGVSLCLLSSTSAYLPTEGVITEESPWNMNHPRFAAEEALRVAHGATIVPLVGLFGGSRDPRQWLLRGLVKDLSGGVNLISHEDAGLCVAHLLRSPPRGQRVNIGAGVWTPWSDIAKSCDLMTGVSQTSPESASPSRMRVVSNARFLGLCPELRHHQFARVADVFGG